MKKITSKNIYALVAVSAVSFAVSWAYNKIVKPKNRQKEISAWIDRVDAARNRQITDQYDDIWN